MSAERFVIAEGIPGADFYIKKAGDVDDVGGLTQSPSGGIGVKIVSPDVDKEKIASFMAELKDSGYWKTKIGRSSGQGEINVSQVEEVLWSVDTTYAE